MYQSEHQHTKVTKKRKKDKVNPKTVTITITRMIKCSTQKITKNKEVKIIQTESNRFLPVSNINSDFAST